VVVEVAAVCTRDSFDYEIVRVELHSAAMVSKIDRNQSLESESKQTKIKFIEIDKCDYLLF